MNILTTYFTESRLFTIIYARDDVRRIQQRYFIYRSIFAIQALRKRHVHVHCVAYHFKMCVIDAIKTKSIIESFVVECPRTLSC